MVTIRNYATNQNLVIVAAGLLAWYMLKESSPYDEMTKTELQETIDARQIKTNVAAQNAVNLASQKGITVTDQWILDHTIAEREKRDEIKQFYFEKFGERYPA